MRQKHFFFLLSFTLVLSGCKTVSSFVQENQGLAFGCTAGIVGGYLAKGDRGAIIGGVLGCGLGYLYDQRRRELAQIAQESNMDVAYEEVKVTYTDADTSSESTSKLLSSSFAHEEIFRSGSAQLSTDAEAAFVKAADKYRDSKTKLMIVGHSDASGSAAYNQALSEKRAKAVAKLLSSQGIPATDLYYQGAGEAQPIASNITPQGRALNRRVEIVEIGASNVLGTSTLLGGSKGTSGNPTEYGVTEKEADEQFAKYAQKRSSDIRNVTFVTEEAPKRPVSRKVKGNFIDFGGHPLTSDQSEVFAAVGAPEPPAFRFSLFSQAYADSASEPQLNCAAQERATAGAVKNLSTGRTVQAKPSEYVAGMNQSVWHAKSNNHLVALSRVAVLKDDYQVPVNPELFIYKDYQGGSNKADYRLNTYAKAYEGKNGFLYRVFVESENAPVQCIDLMMPKGNKAFKSQAGSLFYTGSDGGTYVAGYAPQKAK